MKGIIFTELIEMVEEGHGLKIADQLLSHPDLSSQGVFIATGTYPVTDLEILLAELENILGANRDALLNLFSGHLFKAFGKRYPELLGNYESSFALLEKIESHIHVEVRKLYPDAELPEFEVVERTDKNLIMIYRSTRNMEALAHGLMQAAGQHFEEELDITQEKLPNGATRFLVTKV